MHKFCACSLSSLKGISDLDIENQKEKVRKFEGDCLHFPLCIACHYPSYCLVLTILLLILVYNPLADNSLAGVAQDEGDEKNGEKTGDGVV